MSLQNNTPSIGDKNLEASIFKDPEIAKMLLESSPLEHTISVTLFDGLRALTINRKRMSLIDLANLSIKTSAVSKDKLPNFKLAKFGDQKTDKGSWRSNRLLKKSDKAHHIAKTKHFLQSLVELRKIA